LILLPCFLIRSIFEKRPNSFVATAPPSPRQPRFFAGKKLYAAADAGADATDAGADSSSKQDDDVVDAEFEEVKDDEKK